MNFAKVKKELIFTDILMIGLNLVWLSSILFQMIGVIPVELSGIMWFVHFCFGIPSILWYLGLRARVAFTPQELKEVISMNSTGYTGGTASRWNNPNGVWKL